MFYGKAVNFDSNEHNSGRPVANKCDSPENLSHHPLSSKQIGRYVFILFSKIEVENELFAKQNFPTSFPQ